VLIADTQNGAKQTAATDGLIRTLDGFAVHGTGLAT
jgi:hypothetical protein